MANNAEAQHEHYGRHGHRNHYGSLGEGRSRIANRGRPRRGPDGPLTVKEKIGLFVTVVVIIVIICVVFGIVFGVTVPRPDNDVGIGAANSSMGTNNSAYGGIGQ